MLIVACGCPKLLFGEFITGCPLGIERLYTAVVTSAGKSQRSFFLYTDNLSKKSA